MSTPSIRLPIPGFPGYAAQDDATIWSCLQAVGPWQPLSIRIQTTRGGMQYRCCGITRADGKHYKAKKVATLMLLAFHGPKPPGMECRHLDGNSLNDVPTNLAWGTKQENENDKKIHGTANFFGSRHPSAVLTEQDIPIIRQRIALGHGLRAIARDYNIVWQAIQKIRDGKNWTHV